MLYGENIAISSEINTKHINSVAEFKILECATGLCITRHNQ
jgi:hypothetical protein